MNRIDQDSRLMALKSMNVYLGDKTNESMADAVGGVVAALAGGGIPRSAIDVPTVRNFVARLGKGEQNAWRAVLETDGFDLDEPACTELIANSPHKDEGFTIDAVIGGQKVTVAAFVPKSRLLELGREARLGPPTRIVSFDTRAALRAKLVLDATCDQTAAA